MPTMFRLPRPELEVIVKLLKPELPDESIKGFNADKLKVIISEWLLLNDFSTLHLFEKNANSEWIHPRENQCDCCWKFRVGRRKLSSRYSFSGRRVYKKNFKFPTLTKIEIHLLENLKCSITVVHGLWHQMEGITERQNCASVPIFYIHRMKSQFISDIHKLLPSTKRLHSFSETSHMYKSESKCCSLKQLKNSLMACICFECCRIN